MTLITQLKQEHVEIMHSFQAIKDSVATGKSDDANLINSLSMIYLRFVDESYWSSRHFF